MNRFESANSEIYGYRSSGLDRLRAMREAGIKIERLDPIEKACRHPTSLRLAVNAKCWDCIGRGADPAPRQNIRDCQITGCSLWPVRPYQSVKGKTQTDEDDDGE